MTEMLKVSFSEDFNLENDFKMLLTKSLFNIWKNLKMSTNIDRNKEKALQIKKQ